jgi:hypothetical protein
LIYDYGGQLVADPFSYLSAFLTFLKWIYNSCILLIYLVWGLTLWVPLLPYIFPSWFQSFLLIFTFEISSPIWIDGVGLGRKSHPTRLRKRLPQQILVDHRKRRYIHWYKFCFRFVYLPFVSDNSSILVYLDGLWLCTFNNCSIPMNFFVTLSPQTSEFVNCKF